MHFYFFRQMTNKRHIFFLVAFFLSFVSASYAVEQTSINKIIKSNSISDVLKYADQDTLVAFDLDNTLIEGVHDFSCPAWWDYRISIFQERGQSYDDAVKRLGEVFPQITDINIFHAIEETETLHVLKMLYDNNIKTMVLTARLFVSQREVTKNHLSQSKIHLCNNLNCDNEILFPNEAGFDNGILYSGVVPRKGELLLEFLKKINYVPKKIVFVDDSMEHVQNVHDALTGKNIPSICIRYGYADARIAGIDEKEADKGLLKLLGEQRYNKLFEEAGF